MDIHFVLWAELETAEEQCRDGTRPQQGLWAHGGTHPTTMGQEKTPSVPVQQEAKITVAAS